ATDAFYQLSVGWRGLPCRKLGAAFRGVSFSAKRKVAVGSAGEGTDVRTQYDVTDRLALNLLGGTIVSPAPFLDIGLSVRPRPAPATSSRPPRCRTRR